MFYLIPIVVFLGLVINHYLKKKFSSEVKQLNSLFNFSEKFFIILIIILSIYISFNFSSWFFIFLITGILLGIFLKESMLYLGFLQTIFNLYLSSITFIYLLFSKEKLTIKNTLLFLIPLALLFIPINPWIFLAISSGALIPKLFQ